ncbi:MAG: excinuclease ABC subunit UvrA [Sphaerochaetaceae bacterium]|jgi:excinuclease ABC subunit A|nr:excinuclease ABC subunit UvrA [Sphaerochaetaceae bacterium]
MNNKLVIKGAREHNLKNVSLVLEKDKLIVISGLSGSGKSSLAFDTIFAEGQRRYMESLSAYARQFLGRMDKPDVDSIEGLSPAISIEQKSVNKNPRSTVGTITEILDYYRLLFARIGHPHCPNCGREIAEMSIDQITDRIFDHPDMSRLLIISPVAIGKKGEYKKTLSDAKKSGFSRAKIDGRIVVLDDNPIVLDKKVKHSIGIVTDRLILRVENRQRLVDSLETAAEMSGGLVEVGFLPEGDGEPEYVVFSEKNSCPECGISIGELQPRLFSFNSPFGACKECNGLGFKIEFDPAKIIPDCRLSFNQGAIKSMNPEAYFSRASFEALADKLGFSLDTPFCDLSPDIMNVILYGFDEMISVHVNQKDGFSYNGMRKWAGVVNDLKRRMAETSSMAIRSALAQYQSSSTCENCHGRRLNPESLAVTVCDRNIMDLTDLSVKDSMTFFNQMKLSPNEETIARQICKEILSRLVFLRNVGLDYLTLSRSSATLSGGEAQRIRLASQLGSSLSGVLYVLDEPSIGLHQRDNQKLIDTLKNLRDLGNTVIVVEHDEDTIRQADYVVDMGPGAGEKGGEIIAEGTPEEVAMHPESITGQYLSGKLQILLPLLRRPGNGAFLRIKGVRKNNLDGVDVDFPLGKMIVISGVSGSGKSTLLNQVLVPALKRHFNRQREVLDGYCSIEGLENIDKVISIDQSPIGRTPRSNPATYVGFFNVIRDLFASLPESKARGYSSGRFSFNVPGGRCESCKGDGTKKIEMQFLSDVYVKCDVCNGRRYNQETLSVKYKGKSIYDVLQMSVAEAYEFFSAIPSLKKKLGMLNMVGLDYIRLGQSALTLSGGEAQRVKLSLELSKISTGKTLYILDEPTTGLHFADVKKLMEVLNRFADNGNTVILIEHNLDVIKMADYVIDLGPEGGNEGGKIVCTGTPEDIASCDSSYTGHYLRKMLDDQRI